jgi:hypothetical protein
MPLAHLLIRQAPQYRRDAFAAGLQACGFTLAGEPRALPGPGDVLVIWNRYGRNHETAKRFEAVGARVWVAENGPLGRDFRGEHWYSIMGGNPAGGGFWPDYGARRWDSLGIGICEWRNAGREVIILAQRGIGPPGIRQPDGWHRQAADRFHLKGLGPVRIREHPGENPCTPLLEDLRDAKCVVTWASAAALKALLWGVPVLYGYEQWIGRAAGTHLREGQRPEITRPERLPVFHALAWTMWRTHEIATGAPFRLLGELRSGASSITTEAR